ncbi:uncharacterized protein LOC132314307 [Cornus florida]|uniref:uncharacterized protein LOC132314307 n=1 Tax=Cornus florida TaxID=4283 RepID=UPI0028A2A2A5|nr:uncharacterized protein LOC132314307 [Cornus florida]
MPDLQLIVALAVARNGLPKMMGILGCQGEIQFQAADSIASRQHLMWRSIWKCKIPPKLQHFLWKCCNLALPVHHLLRIHGMSVDVVYPRCSDEEESLERILFLCPHSIQIWKLLPLSFDFSVDQSISFVDWWMTLVERLGLKDEVQNVLRLVAFCCWGIWKAGNKFVFDGRLFDPPRVVSLACSSFREFKEAFNSTGVDLTSYQVGGPRSVLCPHPSPSHWLPPPEGIIKCNVDASFSSISHIGGGGAVFRDSRENILHVVVFSPFSASTATMAEAMCLRKVVLWVSTLSSDKLWFTCDSLLGS